MKGFCRLSCVVLAVAGLVVWFGGVRASFAQSEELDPLKVCSDTQKLVMENAFVRIIEERLAPGASQVKHRHSHGVTIAMSSFSNEGFSYTDNHATKAHRKVGDVSWVEAVVHSGKNVSDSEQHVIRIELKY